MQQNKLKLTVNTKASCVSVLLRTLGAQFSIEDGDDSEKVTLKNQFAFFLTLSRLFQCAENVKCQRISLKLIPWGPPSSLERERKLCRHSFTASSMKREIRYFHVVVVQRQQRNVEKSVMHVQSGCFANPNQLLF